MSFNFSQEIFIILFILYPLIVIMAFVFGFFVGRKSLDYYNVKEITSFEEEELFQENRGKVSEGQKEVNIYEEIAKTLVNE